jgi:3-deoxy-D-manno-octulosonic-acid transferase
VISFGLDWDGTFTEDPDLWRSFVCNAKARGHMVTIVTARHGEKSDEVKAEARSLGIDVIFTAGQPKIEAADKAGLLVNVWIDDMPGLLFKEVVY